MKTLNYFTRSVYGNFAAYLDESTPEAKQLAQAVRALTGRKTITQSDIDALRALGLEFQIVADPKSAFATGQSFGRC